MRLYLPRGSSPGSTFRRVDYEDQELPSEWNDRGLASASRTRLAQINRLRQWGCGHYLGPQRR